MTGPTTRLATGRSAKLLTSRGGAFPGALTATDTVSLVPLGAHRPTMMLTRLLTLAAVFTAPVLITAVAAAFWPESRAGTVMVVAVVAAVVGGGQLVRANVLIIAVAFSCAALAAILTLLGTPMLMLHHYGQSTEATVVAERKVGDEHRYLLLAANGQPISPELSERRDVFDPNDLVDVVFDPGGRLEPAYADQMDDADAVLVAAIGCQVVAIALCVPALRWAPTDNPPRHTKRGLWIFER